MEFGDGLLDTRAAAPLCADLDATLVFRGSCHHPFAFLGIMTGWLLDIDVLPGFAAKDRGWAMPMIRGGANEGIDRWIVEYRAEVGHWLDALAESLHSRSYPCRVHVADVTEFDSGNLHEILGQSQSAGETHDADNHAGRRCGRGGLTMKAGSGTQGQACSRDRGGRSGKEVSAGLCQVGRL
jgi:hypothetical protein